MPIRDRVIWGDQNPLSDARYADLDKYVNAIRRGQRPPNVTGGAVFENRDQDLPIRPNGYYREYDVEPTVKGMGRGTYRLVLGGGSDVYITGNHYRDFRQIINMPLADPPNSFASRIEKERNETLAKLDDYRQRLQNQVNQSSVEDKAQQAILTNTDSLAGAAVGFAGFVTNSLFNTPIPDLVIWNNAQARLDSALKAIQNRNVKTATKQLFFARAHYLAALRKFETWKGGIEAAGMKMQVAIGVTAVVLIGAAVGAFAATAVAADNAAIATAAEQTVVRVAATVQRADVVIRIAEATSLEQEAAAERELELAMEEFMRLPGF
jgi:ribonuclease